MRLLGLGLLMTCFAVLFGQAQPVRFIERGSSWEYRQAPLMDWAALQSWRSAEVRRVNWATGTAPFRYGDGRGGTLLREMPGRFGSIYLRQAFDVARPDEFSALELNVNFDDGFVVYLNGIRVLGVHAPEDPQPNSLATGSHESGQFETFSLEGGVAALKSGRNHLAIQGFNVSLSSTDFLLDAELVGYPRDEVAPRLVAVAPEATRVNALTEFTLHFSEPVTGLNASDFWLNDQRASHVEGNGTQFTVHFPELDLGAWDFRWAPDHGVTDFARPPNPLAESPEAVIRRYELIDDIPPRLTQILPPPETTVRRLKRIRLFFSEPITGLTIQDVRVNGERPNSVEGVATGPWTIELKTPKQGIVNVSLQPGNRVTDHSPTPNRLPAEEWRYQVDPSWAAPQVVLNEFLASNGSGLADEDGSTSDWIEIANQGAVSVNLEGWALSDDSSARGKWVFPQQVLKPNEVLVVFASGRDRRVSGSALHTNFKLAADGGYLGLFSPELPREAVDEIKKYPEQRLDISYGRLAEGGFGYFASPSPGAFNGEAKHERLLTRPNFSVAGGYHDEPFQLVMTSPEPRVQIRYTTDGSEPSATSGEVYREPLSIRDTAMIRAVCVASNALPSRIRTATYLMRQASALQSLPTLSLVAEPTDLFGRTGILDNARRRGIEWERPVSAEWFGTERDFQIDAGLRIQGGDYIRHNYRYGTPPPTGKFSFRLYFRGAYGEGRLDHPFIPRAARDEYEHLVLRAGMNDPINPFIVDELIRRLYADMGHGSSQGVLANLFLNGEYQGYYNPVERIDANFLQSRHGGGLEWDIVAQMGEIRQGDAVAWQKFLSLGLEEDLEDPRHYQAVTEVLDIDNFIDYIILNVYVDMDDWPYNNWRAARERAPGGLWRFYVWDGERAFGTSQKRQRGTLGRQRWPQERLYTANNLTRGPLASDAEIARLFRALIRNAEFRLRFADRVQAHYFHGGALTEENVLLRHEELSYAMREVLPELDRSIPEIWVPNRRAVVMEQLATLDLQRSENAPRFSAPGGRVRDGFEVALTANRGRIYYTLDGRDPADSDPEGRLLYTEPLAISRVVMVKARTHADGEWSALSTATYLPESAPFPLQIVEIMPKPIGGAEYEFVELLNTTGVELPLSWFRLQGIDYRFGFQSLVRPGQRLLLASDQNPPAFMQRYPRRRVDGWFAGNLANKGETLRLLGADGSRLSETNYRKAIKGLNLGSGYALERNPGTAVWSRGERLGGTPGQ